LVEKDWCSFGHRFRTRCGHSSANADDDHDVSPIFIQFLDAVFQLVSQFPAYFEYTPCFLLAIAYHLNSGKFGTLLYDSERDREATLVAKRMRSLWEWVRKQTELDVKSLWLLKKQSTDPSLCEENWPYSASLGTILSALNASNFVSPLYDINTAKEILLPPPSMVLRRVKLWEDYFCRYAPQPSMAKKPNSGFDISTLTGLQFSHQCSISGHSQQTGCPCYSSPEEGLGVSKEQLWGFIGSVQGRKSSCADELDPSTQPSKSSTVSGLSDQDGEGEKLGPESVQPSHSTRSVGSLPAITPDEPNEEQGPDEEEEEDDQPPETESLNVDFEDDTSSLGD
jgi:hypothetical protein